MGAQRHELHIEHEGSEEDLRDHLEEHLEHEFEGREELLERLRAQTEHLEQQVSELTLRIEMHDLLMSIAGDAYEVPDEAIVDNAANEDLEERKRAEQEADDKTGKASDKSKQWTAAQYIGAISSVVIGLASVALFIKLLADKVNDRSDDSLADLDAETLHSLETLAAEWKNMSDGDYWRKLADYVEKDPDEFSFGDQIVFMNITIRIGRSSGGFMWDSTQDKVDAVKDLEKAYEDGGSSAASMYRRAATLKYKNAPIPRVVMAGLLKLAFAWLGVQVSRRESVI
jgi:hypothetical protein